MSQHINMMGDVRQQVRDLAAEHAFAVLVADDSADGWMTLIRYGTPPYYGPPEECRAYLFGWQAAQKDNGRQCQTRALECVWRFTRC